MKNREKLYSLSLLINFITLVTTLIVLLFK